MTDETLNINSEDISAEQLLLKQELRSLGLERYWYLQRYQLKSLLKDLDKQELEIERVPVTSRAVRKIGLVARFFRLFTKEELTAFEVVYSDAVKAVHASHLEQQKAQLDKYREYFALASQLPADDIEDEIVRLYGRFGMVGRAPEWFAAFNELVDSVVAQQAHEGDNEPAVRVAQNDFVLTLQHQLALFWRYDELRRKVFDTENAQLIRAFSYFEQHYARDRDTALKDDGTAVTFDADRFSRFITGIEHKLALHSPTTVPVSRKERLLAVDHQARIDAWAEMKDTVLVEKIDPTEQFNALREILIQAPEWRQELSIFRSAMHVQRLMDPQFESSGMEMDETERFIARMTQRVDEELPTDVIFRNLEQELLQTGEHEESLSLVRTQISFEIRNRSSDSAQNIVNYKRRFVESIWAAREKTAGVRPLFSRGQSRKPQLPGINKPSTTDPWRR